TNGGGGYSTEYNAAAGDDFVVPVGQTWYIGEVDVTGSYVDSTGGASSVTITFYKNRNKRPHGLGRSFTVSCTDNNGSFSCPLPNYRRNKPPKFYAGTYWVSVVANCDYSNGCGEWLWTENTNVTGYEAEWENPHAGWHTVCNAGFQPVSECFGSSADMAFTLLGFSSG